MSQIVPVPITPRGGVVKTETERVAEGRWIDADNTYLVLGGDGISRPQKRGGWTVLTATTETALGANPFATISGSNIITVTQTTHLLTVGETVTFAGATAVAGLTIDGAYVITTVNTGNTYTIEHASNANATTTGGGSAVTVTSEDISRGSIRTLHAWRDLNATPYIAAGTYAKLYVYDSAYVQFDVTPETSGNMPGTDPFAVVSGSHEVTVTHTNHGRSVGSTVRFTGATAGGGITIDGSYTVTSIVSGNAYTIEHFTPATSTDATTGGSAVDFFYEIAAGVDLATFGLGAGVGPYGGGTWGTARESSGIIIDPRIWSLDHFGQILLATYNIGTLYDFDPTVAQPWPRAQEVPDAPDDIMFMFVTPERFVVALREGLVLSWCTQGDYTVWTPTATNTANTRTLTEGSKFTGGRVLGSFVSMIWTDGAAYLMQWTGDRFVHNTRLVGTNCGLISPSAACTVAGVAYWMGADNFWLYDGSVKPIPAVEDIRRYVFDLVTRLQMFQCHAYFNPKFNQIHFVITQDGDIEPSLHVIYNIAGQTWINGMTTETAATHFLQGDTRPIAAHHTINHLYLHEDTFDADGVAMTAYIQLAPYALQEGLLNIDIEGMLLDIHEQAGDLTILFESWDRLTDDDPMDTDQITQEVGDGLLDVHMSGRYVGFTLTSNTLGGNFRVGKPAAFTRPTGRRR